MIDAEPPHAEDAPKTAARQAPRLRRWWPVALTVAAAVIVGAALWPAPEPSAPVLAARALDAFAAGRLALGISSADPAAVAGFLEPRVTFPVRVPDVARAAFPLAGGRVHSLNGRAAALWASRGTSGSVVGLLYRGQTAALPPAVETRAAGGVAVLVFHEEGGTQVFWQNGEVVCALASAGSADDLVRLAALAAAAPPP